MKKRGCTSAGSSEKYGVFVSPLGSDTTGVGTRNAPYKTLTKGLQSAKGNVMRVYACDDGTAYPDALTIDATIDGMSLYGGFECTGWTYAVSRRARQMYLKPWNSGSTR